MQGWPTPTLLTFVLNVIVNQEGVVEKFNRGSKWYRFFKLSTKCPRRGNAYSRSHHLAASTWIVKDQLMKVGRGWGGAEVLVDMG